MSRTLTTGYSTVYNGGTTSLDLSAYTNLISSRVRWKGVQKSAGYTYSTNSSSASGTRVSYTDYPSVPSGYSFYRHKYTITGTFKNEDQNLSHAIWLKGDTGDLSSSDIESDHIVIGSEETKTITLSGYFYTNQVGHQLSVTLFASNTDYVTFVSSSVTAQTTGRKSSYLQTQNPTVTISGQTTQHSGTLNNGVVSVWYDLQGLTLANNTISHSISGSEQAQIEIEYTVQLKPIVDTLDPTNVSYSTVTINGDLLDDGGESTNVYLEYGTTQSYGTVVDLGVNPVGGYSSNLTGLEYGTTYYYRAYAVNSQGSTYGEEKTFTTLYPYLPSPTHESPEDGTKTQNRNPYFEFTINPRVDGENIGNCHARIRISEYLSMINPIVLESKNDQTNWELWDGVSSWIPFPADGVPQGSKVRCKPLSSLPIETLYWDAATWDGNYYGSDSNPWSVRILISVEELYVLLINNIDYKVIDNLSISETSNGQVGEITFSLKNVDGSVNSTIDYGDEVKLAINDYLGNTEEFKGIIRDKIVQSYMLTIKAPTGAGILAERLIKEDYPEQDIGVTVKAIVDTYCQPLTSTNVNTATGLTAPITAVDKTPVKVLEEIRRQYGLKYFVDKDWDFHLYDDVEIANSNITIQYGDVV